MIQCSICGGTEFRSQKVLWPELISAWSLSEEEVAYVDRQQGCSCTGCGASLRIIALGNSIRRAFDTDTLICDFVHDPRLRDLDLLDINGAAGISEKLSALPRYSRGDYPQVDMEALPFPDGSFDLVLHSDTLEHVPHPVRALEQCRRVLRKTGRLCFTVPTIVGRLSRSREGMPKSWHGNAFELPDDFLVRTEFGADAWTYVLRAGFEHVSINHVDFPAATAICAF